MPKYFNTIPPVERRLLGRQGGLNRVLAMGRDESTEAARAGFKAKFERQVDPDGTLDEIERAKLADLALRSWMARLGLASAKARRAASAAHTEEVPA